MEVAVSSSPKKKNPIIVFILILLILLAGLLTGLILITGGPQDLRGRAGGPVCPAEGAICSWSPPQLGKTPQTGLTYHFKITDTTTSRVVKEGDTTSSRVTFTPLVGHVYRCEVSAKNSCGSGPVASAQNQCNAIITPTSTPVPTETPTPTESLTPTITPTGTLVPTVTPTSTPTRTPTSTSIPTLTPTGTLIPIPTGTLAPTNTSTPTPQTVATATPTEIVVAQVSPTEAEASPTVPAAGSSAGVYFIVIAGIVLVTLLLVF